MKFLTIILAFGFLGCAHHQHHKDKMSCEGALAAKATGVAEMKPLGKSKASGTVRLIEAPNGVTLIVALKGLGPNSSHGFHIHENGNCSSPDGSSAGGHYNPLGMPHAAPTDPSHHLGDLGNVAADAKGEVSLEVLMPNVRLAVLAGRAFILHAKPDDLKSQPAGAAGDRIACGVIGYAP